MPSLPYPTPPSWVEADSIRETLLYLWDDPADREAIRHVGRMLHDLALETTREPEGEEAQTDDPGEESQTRAELRAAAADLRYTSGYLHNVIRFSAEWCSLDESDDRLAHFAGKLSRLGQNRHYIPSRRERMVYRALLVLFVVILILLILTK